MEGGKEGIEGERRDGGRKEGWRGEGYHAPDWLLKHKIRRRVCGEGARRGPGTAEGQRWVLGRLQTPPAAILWQYLPWCQGWAAGPEQSPARPSPARRGGEGRGAGGGLHATVRNVLPRPPRLPIDRDKHANESLCMSLAYRQIAGGGAAVCALQRALMQHPNSHCGSLPPAAPAAPRAPRRGQWVPITPSHPPARRATTEAAPPGTRLVQLARGCRAQGKAGINKAKPGEAALLGLFLCFHPFSCSFTLCREGSRWGAPQPPPLAASLPPPPLIEWVGCSGERE